MSAKQYGIPTPIQFDRLYAGPLDKHEVFDSYSEALTYAQGPISYPGQVIGVKKSGLKEDVYVINQDKSLSRLMIQRDDIRAVLYADKWTGEVPYEQTITVPYLELTDNCIISLGESVTDPEVVREIVNAKIGDTIQEEGSIRFIARGDIPKVNIPITITIASVVSAVEIPNNVNDNTNHTVVIAKKDEWKGTKPPYTQDLYVFGVRPDSNGTIGINPDSSYAQINKMAAATAGVVRYEQKNNYVTIAAMNSKPTRDLEVLVVWGDEIVVFENSDTLEDFNTTVDLVLKANEWSEQRPYRQTLRVEGLSEYHTGAIGLSDNCTPEEAEIGLNASLKLIEQGNGYIIVEATDIKPIVDLPIYLTYGSTITIVPSPEYVGEANRHVDSMAYASKWVKTVDGWEQEIDVEGITSNSIGTMSLRNGITEVQTYAAATARIKITKVYDNKVLLTATRIRPNVNIPLCFVFGRNVNVAKYLGITGKVALDTNYIIFDDNLIDSGLSTLQQLLEYLQRVKIFYDDVVDIVHDGDLHQNYIPEVDSVWKYNMPLSARMGRYLFKRKINYDDIIDNVETANKLKPLSANMGKYLDERLTTVTTNLDNKFTARIDKLELDNNNAHTAINKTINDFKNQNSAQHEDIIDSIDTLKAENIEQHLNINNRITVTNNALGTNVIILSENEPKQSDLSPELKGRNIIWIKTENQAVTGDYTVTFNPDGGTGQPSSITTSIGNPITIPGQIPTKSGYTFRSWSRLGITEDIKPGSYFSSDSDITLYANWDINLNKVTLDNQGATYGGISEVYFNYGQNKFYTDGDEEITSISNSLPEKTDYNFDGYYTAQNGNGIKYIDASGNFVNALYNVTSDITLYASWINDGYTISYNANGGQNVPASQTANIGSPITITSSIPSKTGYDFVGWSLDSTATIATWKPGDSYTLDVPNTLYAVWKLSIYTVTLINNLEDENNRQYNIYYRWTQNQFFMDEECSVEIPNIVAPIYDNAIFNGYYDSSNKQYINSNGEFINSLYNIMGDSTLYANWSGSEYSVEYDVGNIGVGNYTTHKGIVGTSITISNNIPTYNTNDGTLYEFIGWSDSIDPDTIYKPGDSYTIRDNATLLAEWELIHQVILNDNNAEVGRFYFITSRGEKYYEDPNCTKQITQVTPLNKEGYIFDGYWYYDDKTGEANPTYIQYIDANGQFINSLYAEQPDSIIKLDSKWIDNTTV